MLPTRVATGDWSKRSQSIQEHKLVNSDNVVVINRLGDRLAFVRVDDAQGHSRNSNYAIMVLSDFSYVTSRLNICIHVIKSAQLMRTVITTEIKCVREEVDIKFR